MVREASQPTNINGLLEMAAVKLSITWLDADSLVMCLKAF